MTPDQRRTLTVVAAGDTLVMLLFAVGMTLLAGPDAPVWGVLADVAGAWTHAVAALTDAWASVVTTAV